MTALVTQARPEDTAAIQRLAAKADSPFEIQRELERAHARLWIVREGEGSDVAGFLLAWEVADEVHVIDLVVAEDQRRRGFGRALLEQVVQRARDNVARLVLLEVRRTNEPAIALYAAFGFEQSGERKAYYADGEDAWLMQLVLS